MNKRHYEHTLPNIRGSLSNTYGTSPFLKKGILKTAEEYSGHSIVRKTG